MTKNATKLPTKPPAFFDTYAKGMWAVLVPYLSTHSGVKSIDQNLVEMYCTQYGIYRRAYASIKKDGIQSKIYKTVQNSAGEKIGTDFVGFKRNPSTSVYNDALKQLTTLGAQLGLSPKSRAELATLAGPKDSKNAEKTLKEMFGGGTA